MNLTHTVVPSHTIVPSTLLSIVFNSVNIYLAKLGGAFKSGTGMVPWIVWEHFPPTQPYCKLLEGTWVILVI